MLIDIDLKREDTLRIIAEHERRRQEIWWYPWVVVISGMTAGGALVAAGATLTKLFG